MNIKNKKLKPLTNKIQSQATEQKEEVKKEDIYILVAGSRTLENYELVSKYLDIEFANNGITPEKYNITIVEVKRLELIVQQEDTLLSIIMHVKHSQHSGSFMAIRLDF